MRRWSRVLAVVRRIPPGRVATYGDVAAAAGGPRAWRAVGNIMRTCAARDVPCHRVVAAGDSYNDTTMLLEADAGFLFRSPANVVAEFPQLPALTEYDDLLSEVTAQLA